MSLSRNDPLLSDSHGCRLHEERLVTTPAEAGHEQIMDEIVISVGGGPTHVVVASLASFRSQAS